MPPIEAPAGPILQVEDLEMRFTLRSGPMGGGGVVRAVDGVSLSLRRGETGALVGESGSGKSTVGRCILRLLEPTGGRVTFLDTDITHLSRSALRQLRRSMHVVFQDPFTSLNPRMPIGKIVIGPLVHHRLVRRRDRRERAAQLLDLVGLGSRLIDRYPHSLSGGQRQRVAIARALSADPQLLIADEPISALDASIQAAMLNLLMELQARLGFACLFITHDLSAARLIADWVAVMYLGQVVEHGSSEEVFRSPRHPYTQALLSAVPLPDPRRQRERQPIILAGDPPSPLDPPAGCRFHGRCPVAIDRCREVEPVLGDPLDRGHLARCLLVGPEGEAPSLSARDGSAPAAPAAPAAPTGVLDPVAPS
jgi:peptide/nickel transport system ATP-binding protein/oligopeptide transport system ATP-binding protein